MELTLSSSRESIIEYCKRDDNVVPDIDTVHEFVDGMYFRTMRAPAGSLIVGATHKKDSYEILLQGSIAIAFEDGSDSVDAPYTIKTEKGSSKIGYAITDVVYMSVFRTDKTELDDVEKELFVEEIYKYEDDYNSFLDEIGMSDLDIHNRMKEEGYTHVESDKYYVDQSSIHGKGVFSKGI